MACGLMRAEGMIFPANGNPVAGSTRRSGRPKRSTVCEKLPARSGSVGISADCVLVL